MAEEILNKAEKDLLSKIDEKELINFLQKAVQSNSENPPGNEKEIAFLFKEKLESLGLKVQMQEVEKDRFNVIALLPGESHEELLFNGHLDTVKIGTPGNWTKDPLGAEIFENKLYGRGSCDMKSGLSAMVFALEALVKSNLPRKKSILFTAVIDEEVYFKGTQALIDADILKNCTRAYISEPTSLGIASCLQGAAEFTARVYGKSAHSGMAELGINAIFHMNKIISALEEYHLSLEQIGDRLGLGVNPSLNIGKIQGGTGVILVPDYCQIEFDRQVLPGENMEEVIAEIENLFKRVCQKEGIKGELICNQYFSSWQVSKEHPVVKALESCHKKATGNPAAEMMFRAYCEVEMVDRLNIPGAVYGPGNILQAHRPDEFVNIDEVISAAKTYALLAYDFVK